MTLLEKKIENELLQDSNVEDAQRRIARIMQKYDLDAYEVVLDETKYNIRLGFPDHGGTIRIIVNDARMLFPDQWEFRNVLLRLLEHV
jgi:hypothetical protein